MANHKRILFLTLRIFSATGGIEKICKVAGKALCELLAQRAIGTLKIFSMYDGAAEVEERYISNQVFKGFGNSKASFVIQSVTAGLKSDVILVSHINLLSVGYLIKLFKPGAKLMLYAHGIEVWGPLSSLRIKMLCKCDCILAVSEFTKQKMVQQYALEPKKIIVLNNCIDPYLQAPLPEKDTAVMHQYGFNSNQKVLMTLTRLSSKELYKGYDHVLLSVAELRKKYPGIKYLIVGRYDEAEKKRLDAIVEQHSLQEAVVFTGYIPDSELAAHYSLADVYVMPSKKEGFGIVFIEAMHFGLPVIAGNKDGSADALCNGKLGVLIDPDDQHELNESIEKVLLNKNLYVPDPLLLAKHFSFAAYKARLSDIIA